MHSKVRSTPFLQSSKTSGFIANSHVTCSRRVDRTSGPQTDGRQSINQSTNSASIPKDRRKYTCYPTRAPSCPMIVEDNLRDSKNSISTQPDCETCKTQKRNKWRETPSRLVITVMGGWLSRSNAPRPPDRNVGADDGYVREGNGTGDTAVILASSLRAFVSGTRPRTHACR